MHPSLLNVRKKSTYIPPKNRNASLETYCRLVEQDVKSVFKNKTEQKTYNNLPKKEREALTALRNDSTLVVRPADKGGAVVIQDLLDYESEVYRQLNDINFYKKLSSDPTSCFKNYICDRLNRWPVSGDIKKSEFDFMLNDFPITPVIYCILYQKFINHLRLP